jgi:hypothetical protein
MGKDKTAEERARAIEWLREVEASHCLAGAFALHELRGRMANLHESAR